MSIYQEKIKQLIAMGFDIEPDITLHYLQSYNGNLELVIEDLLQNHTSPEIEKECKHDDISRCAKLRRFSKVMSRYLNEQKCDDMDVIEILNDFIHLVCEHKHTESTFDVIFQNLGPCDVAKCTIFRRNYRDRNSDIKRLYTEHELKNVAYCQILDKVHCYYQHCFDIGNKIPIENKEILQVNQDISTSLLNNNVIAINKYLSNKRQLLQHLSQKSNRMNTKYHQLSCNGKSKHKMYDFGVPFVYVDAGTPFEYDPQKQYVCIPPKYSSLKQELISNNVSTLCIDQFNYEYLKAQIHFGSNYRKKTFIQMFIHHVLSLMLYCNFDGLQHEFSKTYRDSNIKQHSNYYWLGMYLTDAVHKFGDIVSREYGPFYHGIGEELFLPQLFGRGGNYLGVKIYCPLSTSSVIEVALNFTNNNNGLVIQFDAIDNGFHWQYTRCFSVNWLSDYGNEQEILFIQNFDEIQIDNVLCAKTGTEYKLILNALKIMQNAFSYQENWSGWWSDKKFHQDLVSTLIKNRLSYFMKEYEPFKSLDSYAKSIMDVFCESKEYIYLPIDIVKYPWATVVYDPSTNCVKQEMYVLFPNACIKYDS
eukprot:422512_1